MPVICLQLWQGRWQGDEIIVKVLQVRDWTTRKSRDFNEEHPKLRYISSLKSYLGTFLRMYFFFHICWQTRAVLWEHEVLDFISLFCPKRVPQAVSTSGEMFWNVVSLQLSSADEDFHTFSGTFCRVFIGFFLIQTFCLFLGPVSHLHHLTPSSLLTTCHMDRCSTYSTKALVSRFIFMYNSDPTFTLLIIPTFQFFPVPLFGDRTKTSLRSNYDIYWNIPVGGAFSSVYADSVGIRVNLTGPFLDGKGVFLCVYTWLNVIQHQQKIF